MLACTSNKQQKRSQKRSHADAMSADPELAAKRVKMSVGSAEPGQVFKVVQHSWFNEGRDQDVDFEPLTFPTRRMALLYACKQAWRALAGLEAEHKRLNKKARKNKKKGGDKENVPSGSTTSGAAAFDKDSVDRFLAMTDAELEAYLADMKERVQRDAFGKGQGAAFEVTSVTTNAMTTAQLMELLAQ